MAEELPESELILMMDRYRGKAYTVTKVYYVEISQFGAMVEGGEMVPSI